MNRDIPKLIHASTSKRFCILKKKKQIPVILRVYYLSNLVLVVL